jgi:hypothetical protein
MKDTYGDAPMATDEQSLKTWRIQVSLRQKVNAKFGNSLAEAIHLLRTELKENYYIDLIDIKEITNE